jgi:hypothetical protein
LIIAHSNNEGKVFAFYLPDKEEKCKKDVSNNTKIFEINSGA